MRFRLRTLLIGATLGPPTVGMLGVMRKLEFVDHGYYVSLLLLWVVVSAVGINFTCDGITWYLHGDVLKYWISPMFRFTRRDLLWLLVVVGMSVGWWRNNHSWNRYYGDTMRLVVREANDSNSRIIELSAENSALKKAANE